MRPRIRESTSRTAFSNLALSSSSRSQLGVPPLFTEFVKPFWEPPYAVHASLESDEKRVNDALEAFSYSVRHAVSDGYHHATHSIKTGSIIRINFLGSGCLFAYWRNEDVKMSNGGSKPLINNAGLLTSRLSRYCYSSGDACLPSVTRCYKMSTNS